MSRNILKIKRARRAVNPDPPDPGLYPLVYPHNGWNGSPTPPIWEQEEITTAAPTGWGLFSMSETITEAGVLLGVSCDVNPEFGGIEKVQAACGDRVTDILNQGFFDEERPDGTTSTRYGFIFECGWTQAMAMGGGREDVYFKIIPTNPLMQERIIGPFTLNFRATPYDTLLRCAMTPGFPGATSGYAAANSIKLAFDYACTHLDELVHVELIEDTEYDVDIAANATTLLQKMLIIRPENGQATLGDGTKTSQNLSWRVSNFEIRVPMIINRLSTRLSNAITISNGALCTFRYAKIMNGAEDLANGLTGSGAGQLVYGRRPSTSWLGNNTNANYEFIDCELTDLPEFALAAPLMALGNRLDTLSGTAIEFARRYAGWNSITNLSAVDSGYRTYKHAIDITGPANSWIEKVGLNGSTGALNAFEDATNITCTCSGTTLTVTEVSAGTVLAVGQYLRGSGINSGARITALGTGTGGAGTYTISQSITFGTPRTLYPSTHSIAITTTIPTNTRTTDITAGINSWGGSWAAVHDDTNDRDASYLILNGAAPGFGFGPTSVGSGLSLYTIIDSHTNFGAEVLSGLGPGVEDATPSVFNCLWEFNVVPRVITSGSWAMGDRGRRFAGVVFRYSILYDASLEEGADVQQGRFKGIHEFVDIRNVTFMNVGMQCLADYEARGDYNTITNCIFQQLSASGTDDPALIIRNTLVHSSAALLSGADSSCRNLGASALLADIFDNPTDPDIFVRSVPILDGPAKNSDDTYAGARLPTALHSEQNRGWNLL